MQAAIEEIVSISQESRGKGKTKRGGTGRDLNAKPLRLLDCIFLKYNQEFREILMEWSL